MDSKKHLYKFHSRKPLGKYEFVEVKEMTWDEACQHTTNLLNGHAVVGGKGEAISVKFARCGKSDWTFIPQW